MPTRGCGGSPTTVNTYVWRKTTVCLCFVFCSQMRRLTGCSRFQTRCPTTSTRSRLHSASGLLRMPPQSRSTLWPSGTVNWNRTHHDESAEDDLICFHRDAKHHIKFLAQILAKFRKFKLCLYPSKLRFAMSSVNFLGYEIGQNGYTTDTSRTSDIKKLPKTKITA